MINTSFGKGYRTLFFNLLVAVGAAAGAITDTTDTKTAITMIVFAIVNAGLRWITDGPVPSKAGTV